MGHYPKTPTTLLRRPKTRGAECHRIVRPLLHFRDLGFLVLARDACVIVRGRIPLSLYPLSCEERLFGEAGGQLGYERGVENDGRKPLRTVFAG